MLKAFSQFLSALRSFRSRGPREGVGIDKDPPFARLTEIPPNSFWAGILRFFKTFEVILFKLLQFFEVYRPQKFILGIPSLATKDYASLQAVVTNGTQDDFLAFRPRRLLHRVLRGLPDLEMFERIRFQVAISERALRSVEATTETRGFVHLQLNWQIPWDLPRISWLRMKPLGVETVVGRIELGDYEVVSSPVFFLNDSIQWVLVSDIDDTIKDSRIAETTSFKKIISALFKGNYYSYHAISGMSELYQELAANGVMIVYLTSTPYQLAPFLLKFLRDAKFPEGPVFPRWLGYNRYGHKIRSLRRVLTHLTNQKCVLVGDSGEEDLNIYRHCAASPGGDHVKRILIRHVPGTPLPSVDSPHELIYKSIDELRRDLSRVLHGVLK